MIKKLIFGTLAFLAIPAMIAYAATPMLSVSGQGNGNVSVSVSGGEINAPVVLFYHSATVGTVQGFQIGTTDMNGSFSGTVNTDARAISGSVPVYVQVGGYQSNSVVWPFTFSGTTNTNTSFNSGSSNSGSVMFSQPSPSMSVGQTGTVVLSGGNGTFFVASNSNSNGVVPTISGNVLTLSGAAAGQANIVVCSTGGGCGTLTANVQGSASPTLSQSSLNVTQNGQGSVNLSGGVGPFSVQIPSGSGISTMLMGNTLFVNGTATGTSVINVCSSNTGTAAGGCTPLTVSVQAQATSNTPANTTNSLAAQFSSTVPLTVGQVAAFNLGNNGSFFLQSPVSGPALASINDGNRLLINGSMAGSGTLTVCQNGGSCFPINFVVNPGVTASAPVFTGTGGGILLDVNMGMGMRGQSVVDLQTRLKEEGYFSPAITGYFGGATQAAVKRYQRDHNIPATGFVGVQTRAMLNQ